MSPLPLLGWLIVAHALCDYPLQGPFLSAAKNRFSPVAGFPWYQAMGAHVVIHGGAVALITGIWWLGLLEAIAHALIDDLKCEGRLSVNADQFAHLLCKVMWTVAFVMVAQ